MADGRPLQEGHVLTGPLFNEPMRVETVRPSGPDMWIAGLVGIHTDRFRNVTLSLKDIQGLRVQELMCLYTGDGQLLRLGLQAYALGIAYEFDPYFGLSISRVDPLPHQLEANYDCLLKLAHVRFLLADDAGAGKTIMAGLLIRELKLHGLAERAKQLFGEDGASAVADRIEAQPTGPVQLTLFIDDTARAFPDIKGRSRRMKTRAAKVGQASSLSEEASKMPALHKEATTLDRVHTAMLLQASGRANALRALLKDEQDCGPDFLRLANALSALYPKESEEKRLLDAMPLAVPR